MSVTKIKNFSQFVNENVNSKYLGNKRLFEKGGYSSTSEGHINVAELVVMLKNLKGEAEISEFFLSIPIGQLTTKFTEDARDAFMQLFISTAISEYNKQEVKVPELTVGVNGDKLFLAPTQDGKVTAKVATPKEAIGVVDYYNVTYPSLSYNIDGDEIGYRDCFVVGDSRKRRDSDFYNNTLGDNNYRIDWDSSNPDLNILGLVLLGQIESPTLEFIPKTTLGGLLYFVHELVYDLSKGWSTNYKSYQLYNSDALKSFVDSSSKIVPVEGAKSFTRGLSVLTNIIPEYDNVLNTKYTKLLSDVVSGYGIKDEVEKIAITKDIFAGVSKSPVFADKVTNDVMLTFLGKENIPYKECEFDESEKGVVVVDKKAMVLSPNSLAKEQKKGNSPTSLKAKAKKITKKNEALSIMGYSSFVNRLYENAPETPNLITFKSNKLGVDVLRSIMEKKPVETILNTWGESFASVVKYFGKNAGYINVDAVSDIVGSTFSEWKDTSTLKVSGGEITLRFQKTSQESPKNKLYIKEDSVRFNVYNDDSLLNSITMIIHNPDYMEKEYQQALKKPERNKEAIASIEMVRDGVKCTLATLLYFKYLFDGWDTDKQKNGKDAVMSIISMMRTVYEGEYIIDKTYKPFINFLKEASPTQIKQKYSFLRDIKADNIFDMLGTNSKVYTTQVIKYTSHAFLLELYKYLNVKDREDLCSVYGFTTTATKDSEIIAIDLGGMKLLKESEIPSDPGKEVKGLEIAPQKGDKVLPDNNSRKYNNRYPSLNEAKSCKGKVVKFLKDNDCVVDYEAGTCKVGTKTMKIEKALLKFKAPESLIKSYTMECTKEVNEALRLRRMR